MLVKGAKGEKLPTHQYQQYCLMTIEWYQILKKTIQHPSEFWQNRSQQLLVGLSTNFMLHVTILQNTFVTCDTVINRYYGNLGLTISANLFELLMCFDWKSTHMDSFCRYKLAWFPANRGTFLKQHAGMGNIGNISQENTLKCFKYRCINLCDIILFWYTGVVSYCISK